MKCFRILTALACVAVVCGPALAIDLYSNQSASPSVPALNPTALSKSGVAAPAGTFWSEVQNNAGNLTESNTVAGFSVFRNIALTSNFRAADDFTVPAPGWRLNGASFFAYRTGNATAPSPFAAAFVQIWNGRPGDVGSAVIAGDLTTNRLSTSVFDSKYRIFNTTVPPPGTAPGTTRPIFKNDAAFPNVDLVAGTYWIEWTYALTTDTFTSFSPSTTHEGLRGVPGANGRQQTGAGATTTWIDAIDAGNPATAPDVPQDYPFILRGEIIPEPGSLAVLGIAGLGLLRRRRA